MNELLSYMMTTTRHKERRLVKNQPPRNYSMYVVMK